MTKNNAELEIHTADHIGKEHDDECLFCKADNEPQGAEAAYIAIVGEEYADKDGFDEAFVGSYKNDEEFAQEQAEQLGEIPKDAHWPHYCIDWAWAARELMMDYSEENGYYFRNM